MSYYKHAPLYVVIAGYGTCRSGAARSCSDAVRSCNYFESLMSHWHPCESTRNPRIVDEEHCLSVISPDFCIFLLVALAA